MPDHAADGQDVGDSVADMPAARTSHLHRLTTIGLAILFVIVGVLGVAAPASAHDSLDPGATSPAPGSTIETMPDQITLAFSEALLTMGPQDTVVEVLAPSGALVSDGDAVVDGALVTQTIGPVTEAGEYTVNWHVVSSDGHPTEDTYTFTVTSATATATQDPTATAQPTATEQPEEPTATAAPGAQDEDGSGGGAWPWILLIAVVIVVVAALLPLVIRQAREGRMNGPYGQS